MSELLDVDIAFAFPRSGAGVSARWRHDLAAGRITVLLGRSGSGKTTLLRCLAGLERPQRGHIRIGDRVWYDAAAKICVAPERRDVGVLFQDYALFPHLSVAHNIGFAAGPFVDDAARLRIRELLELFDLGGLERRRPRELSGGQQQRVALARALFRRPRLLLLDEPLSALDGPTRDAVRDELAALLRGLAVPAYIVTHDRLDALTLGDRTVLLEAGAVVQDGPTHDVFGQPATAVAAGLVGVDSVILGRVDRFEHGLAVVGAGGQEIRAAADVGAGSDVAICIRAEDVTLARHDQIDTSVRNRWRAVVRSEVPDGPFVRVGLDCGFRLSALVTREAWRALALRPGDAAWAMVKAASIVTLPRR